MSKYFCFIVFAFWLHQLVSFRHLETNALPSTTLAPTTHIVSFVHQRKSNAKNQELNEFDYERIENSSGPQIQPHTPLSKHNGRLVQQLDPNLDSGIGMPEHYRQSTARYETDDSADAQRRNTLDNADDVFGHNEQHESSSGSVKQNSSDLESAVMWNRMKQSIPVLEPVKHLLNTVRDGAFNQTAHAARQHHQLVSLMMGAGQMGDQMHTPHQNESSAIETEEEREMANDSTEFQLLDFLGSLVGMIWGFISNIQRIFAASSGNASAALSSPSSSSSSSQ